MSGGIYLLGNDKRLVEMKETAYDSEDLLQGLLASYPSLLAGDQIDQTTPRKWVLISREMGIPDDDEGGDRWSVDHLFLDQDAIPTLVEVKRASDTRIRREVVAQMLDYAANATSYWSLEKIRTKFESACETSECDPETALSESLGIDYPVEEYWQAVKTNLQAKRLRLIFVADEIPPELRRIVEFLNEQMDPAEVLAIEVKQYLGDSNLTTLVPRVIGQTASAQQRKGVGPTETRKWNVESFRETLKAAKGSEYVGIANAILDWAKDGDIPLYWGKGMKHGCFSPGVIRHGVPHKLFGVWTSGGISINFAALQRKQPFASDAKRRNLLERLNAIQGISLAHSDINRELGIRLDDLRQDAALAAFLEAFDWAVAEIKVLGASSDPS